jgi:tetratricopeptide (TPR) repeat protein
MERAVELDPTSPAMNYAFGGWLFYGHRHAEGIDQLRKALELDPSMRRAQQLLAVAHALHGQYGEALDQCEKLMASSDALAKSGRAITGYVFALRGESAQARAVLMQLNPALETDLFVLWTIVPLAIALAELELAFQILDRLAAAYFGPLAFIQFVPTLEPISNDPRFDVLLASIGQTRE